MSVAAVEGLKHQYDGENAAAITRCAADIQIHECTGDMPTDVACVISWELSVRLAVLCEERQSFFAAR
jgi:hypothetical protein